MNIVCYDALECTHFLARPLFGILPTNASGSPSLDLPGSPASAVTGFAFGAGSGSTVFLYSAAPDSIHASTIAGLVAGSVSPTLYCREAYRIGSFAIRLMR